MDKAVQIINKSSDILILTHKNPDGDAVGSVLGLSIALRSVGKNAVVFSSDTISNVFDFLPDISSVKTEIMPRRYDLVILLDCDSIKRTGIEDRSKVFVSFDNMLVIDHHPKQEEPEPNEKYFSIIDPKASSTAILVYGLIKELNIKITKDIATCILTGIFTDTGSFQHSNTDEATLKAAAELMKKGSRVDKISRQIFNNRTIPAIKLWGKALSRIKTDDKTGMAVSYLNKEDFEEYDVSQEELSGLVSIINMISDAKFSLLLTERDDQKLKGSLRSEEYKGIDVSRIARSLGGGGHKLASGFEIDGEVQESIRKITRMVMKTKKR
jgi:bifunctional oligoribonuclease and PAP phosphatase NrnA